MSHRVIQVQNLVKVFPSRFGARGQAPAVDDLSFTVERGTIFGLLGPNGAGKTTTLRVLTTLVRPTSGHASVLGYDVVRQARQVREQIVVVIQEHACRMRSRREERTPARRRESENTLGDRSLALR